MEPNDTAPLDQLTTLLRRFITGADRSQSFVRDEIGGLLDAAFPGGANFPDRGLFEELEVAVACYRPGGGQFMYDEEAAASVFGYVLRLVGTPEA